jgi:hypothetical protein
MRRVLVSVKSILRKGVLVLIMGLVGTNGAFAGWMSWASGIASAAAAALAKAAVKTGSGAVAGAALAAGVAQISLWVGDYIIAKYPKIPIPTKPPAAGTPQPAADTSGSGVTGSYQHLPLLGGITDPIITATNDSVDSLNRLTSDFKAGVTADQLIRDYGMLSGSLEHVADEFDYLGISLSISQADIDSFQAGLATSGLPSFEVDFLQNAGLSASDINGLANYFSSTPLNLAVPTVSVSEVLHGAAATAAVPEPSTLALVGVGIAGILGYGRRRRKLPWNVAATE